MSRLRRASGAIVDHPPSAVPGYVDIHAHLLPGIDDGPPDMAGAVRMARAAAAAGTAVLAATPHLRSDFPHVHVDEIAARCLAVREEVAAAGVELEIVAGAEVSLIWALEAEDDALRLATYGQAGHDVLIETPIDVSMIDQLLYQVRLRGPRVTLAHPERSQTFKKDPARVARLVDQGVLLQVNAEALLGPGRSTTRRFVENLCRAGIAHVLASDAHRGEEWRPVGALSVGRDALERLVGPERAAWMAAAAPSAVLSGGPLPQAPPVQAARRRPWRRLRAR